MIKKVTRNESGLTLVEVLASIVILSLIVVTFLAFFINSARTTKISEENLNSGFIAQKYMEEVYKIATDHASLEEIATALDSLADISKNNLTTFSIKDTYGTGSIIIEQATDDSHEVIDRLLKAVVIYRVTDGKDAKLETRMIYGGG